MQICNLICPPALNLGPADTTHVINDIGWKRLQSISAPFCLLDWICGCSSCSPSVSLFALLFGAFHICACLCDRWTVRPVNHRGWRGLGVNMERWMGWDGCLSFVASLDPVISVAPYPTLSSLPFQRDIIRPLPHALIIPIYLLTHRNEGMHEGHAFSNVEWSEWSPSGSAPVP